MRPTTRSVAQPNKVLNGPQLGRSPQFANYCSKAWGKSRAISCLAHFYCILKIGEAMVPNPGTANGRVQLTKLWTRTFPPVTKWWLTFDEAELTGVPGFIIHSSRFYYRRLNNSQVDVGGKVDTHELPQGNYRIDGKQLRTNRSAT